MRSTRADQTWQIRSHKSKKAAVVDAKRARVWRLRATLSSPLLGDGGGGGGCERRIDASDDDDNDKQRRAALAPSSPGSLPRAHQGRWANTNESVVCPPPRTAFDRTTQVSPKCGNGAATERRRCGGGGGGGDGDDCVPTLTASSSSSLYKTELCVSYRQTRTCRYGDRCKFAHGEHELRPRFQPVKFKTEPCMNFPHCRYGRRCRFIHDESESELALLRRRAEDARNAGGGGRGDRIKICSADTNTSVPNASDDPAAYTAASRPRFSDEQCDVDVGDVIGGDSIGTSAKAHDDDDDDDDDDSLESDEDDKDDDDDDDDEERVGALCASAGELMATEVERALRDDVLRSCQFADARLPGSQPHHSDCQEQACGIDSRFSASSIVDAYGGKAPCFDIFANLAAPQCRAVSRAQPRAPFPYWYGFDGRTTAHLVAPPPPLSTYCDAIIVRQQQQPQQQHYS